MVETLKEALQAIEDEAAAKAYQYLERDAPLTLEAIRYLINNGWPADRVLKQIRRTYGQTEEKTMHKVGLVVVALIRERDK